MSLFKLYQPLRTSVDEREPVNLATGVPSEVKKIQLYNPSNRRALQVMIFFPAALWALLLPSF
jgi:hypothetical protein